MTWKDRLQDASFRGVPFKVEEESAGTGRRVETHEYPNRDKPYTEDLGKITFRPSITAYVVGDDCFDQRDRLIDALNKPGPGTLVHPTYGELKVCVDGEVRVSTSKSEGRIVRFDLKFVEAGELSYPTSGVIGLNGYVTIPLIISGSRRTLIIQWGQARFGGSGGEDAGYLNDFPFAFPSACYGMIVSHVGHTPSGAGILSASAITSNQFRGFSSIATAANAVLGRYIAIGG